MPELSIVIPTLDRHEHLRLVLSRLAGQAVDPGTFEVIVVDDPEEREPEALREAVAACPFPARVVRRERPGASAARNRGWRDAAGSLVLFLGDDILPSRRLVAEHLAWHRRHPEETIGVLGRVRWAGELRVTPFMRWLERGVQFDYASIHGTEAGWGRFYTSNVSVKRAILERAGGFDEERFPFGYEDLDLGLRLSRLGFRLLYARRAVGEHLHPTDVEAWRERMATMAAAERTFVAVHPEVEPYFHRMFTRAARAPRARGRGARLLGVVPGWVPWLGERVRHSADVYFGQALAPAFFAGWEAAAPQLPLASDRE